MIRAIPPRAKYEPLRHWKYRTTEDYVFATNFDIGADFSGLHGFVMLTGDGRMTIKKGYAWDGPSGPAIDSPDGMTGSLVHDAFYQLMREADPFPLGKKWRLPSDRLLKEISIDHGMWPFRAKAWEWAVNVFGLSSATRTSKRLTRLKKRHGLK